MSAPPHGGVGVIGEAGSRDGRAQLGSGTRVRSTWPRFGRCLSDSCRATGRTGYAGLRGARARVAALESLELVELADRADHRPAELSGGEQQRVAIARALVNKPSLVLADEPTGNLDSERTADVLALLRQFNRDHGQTYILVTHDPDVGEASNRAIRMRDGRIRDQGFAVPAAAPAPPALAGSAFAL